MHILFLLNTFVPIKYLLIQIVCFFCTLCVWGGHPTYSFHHSWEVNEGISQLSVVTICQDSRGYLWLGTRNGLNRYNGSGYTIFRHHPGDSLTIVDNGVNKICEDHDNNLWIATIRGVSKMHLPTEHIRNYFIADGLPDEGILSILVDKSGKVWLGSHTGLSCYIPEEDRFRKVEFADNFKGQVTVLMEDKAGNMWIGTSSGGVFVCDTKMT